MLRVLHVGLGPLGRKIVADLHQRRLGEVVAAIDVAPELAGRKLAELVPAASASRAVVRESFDAIGDWRAFDCALVTTSSSLAKCAPTFRALLARGQSIVSTCEELCHPHATQAALARELDELARAKHGRLLGTGVNPGFLMDAFPVFATAISRSVTHVRVQRFQDATTRRVPFQEKIGVGLDDEEFARRVEAGTLRHVGLRESAHFIASALGFEIERYDETIRPVHAERELDSGLGRIARGRVCGVRQEARAFEGERAVIELEFQASLALLDPHDRVVVQGEPPIDLIWKGGVQGDVATSAIVLNSIRPLLSAGFGLHTMASIPLVGCASART